MSLEDIGKNFEGPSWSNRIFFYFCLFSFTLIAFLIVYAVFKAIDFNYTIPHNPQYNTSQLSDMGFFDNERYLLSALVQSLAAVIALVITLSLVAVQLAAQSYSARVIDVYKKNPDMWILLGIYILTIFYGLGLIKIIGLGILSDYMEGAISVAYFLGFFAFVCLIPYIWNTLASLNPLTLIKLLTKNITTEKIQNYLKGNGQKSDEDPVLPVIDVISSALARNDDETVRNGILEIKDTTLDIFESNHFVETEEVSISKFIIQHIERIGIQASDRKNENTSISVILALDDIKRKAIECKLENAVQEVEKVLDNMQIKVLEQKFENATEHIIKMHLNYGIKELEYKRQNLPPAEAQVLTYICMKAIEQKMDLSANIAIKALRDLELKALDFGNNLMSVWIIGDIDSLGAKAAADGNDFVSKNVVKAFENIMMPILDKNKGFLLERVLYALDNISTKAIDNKLESTIDYIIKIFEIVAIKAIGEKYEDEDFSMRILKKLENIATKSLEKELELPLMTVANSIENIGRKAADRTLGTVVIETEKILENAGIKAAEKKLIQATWMNIQAFKNIGTKAAERGLEEETEKYENGLKTLLQKIDDTQKMFVDPAIEEALEAIEQAKIKRK